MRRSITILLAILVLIGALAVGYSFLNRGGAFLPGPQNSSEDSGGTSPAGPSGESAPPGAEAPAGENNPALVPGSPGGGNPVAGFNALPLSAARSRITKKPFGIKVSPASSPVQPERFFGYHTGTDFEILPGEDETPVPVAAVCAGTVAYKNYVSGYGGVLVQRCELDGQVVTVLYGHLKLASIIPAVGEGVQAGEQLGILGRGYSAETDGERKHLHLGIHKGKEIELRGYVQDPAELNAWLDPGRYLPA
jgi:hypothetical protein